MVRFAIIGRPNVGKSALFNRLIGRRIAIVDEREGVTRDRLYAEGHFFGRPFAVIDTGGIDFASLDPLQAAISKQVDSALQESDLVLFVVDGKSGVTHHDELLAKKLHRLSKPVMLIINKMDNPEEESAYRFLSLGFKNSLPISALHGAHIDELLQSAFSAFPEQAVEEAPKQQTLPSIAILGRPNVGKSTLINALLKEERVITSPEAGTTRDSVDIPFQVGSQSYLLIDTAGLRRHKTDLEPLDFYSRVRTERALERADIAILVLDAEEGFTSQERKIASDIEKAKKATLILINKWDKVHGFRMEHCLKALHAAFPSFAHVPTLFISAKSGRNLDKVFIEIEKLARALKSRISTAQLNRFLKQATEQNPPPATRGNRLRIYYMTQVECSPPQFVLFVNRADLFIESYKRYLINQLREAFGFQGIPLTLEIREKVRREEGDRPKGREILDEPEEHEETADFGLDLEEPIYE